MENAQPGLLQRIREKKALTDDIKNDLKQVLTDFKDDWNANGQMAMATSTPTVATASSTAQPMAKTTAAAGV
jgi:hypothetical protein